MRNQNRSMFSEQVVTFAVVGTFMFLIVNALIKLTGSWILELCSQISSSI